MSNNMTPRTRIFVCMALLCTVILLESWTNMDMAVQRLFHTENGWIVTQSMHNAGFGLWFYSGPKLCIAAVGVLCLIGVGLALARKILQHWLRPCLFLALSLALVPLLVSGGKQITNIYCPNELVEFGGTRTYQRLLVSAVSQNAEGPRGKGFPAGHASGGFALMALYFVGTTNRQRRVGLVAGLSTGWIMGIYQMLRGEHFLSHTLFSMILAWLVLCVLELSWSRFFGQDRECCKNGSKRLAISYQ